LRRGRPSCPRTLSARRAHGDIPGRSATLTSEEVARISAPCLLYAGDADPVHTGAREAAGHVADARFISLPGLDHVQAGGSPLILPHVKEFWRGWLLSPDRGRP